MCILPMTPTLDRYNIELISRSMYLMLKAIEMWLFVALIVVIILIAVLYTQMFSRWPVKHVTGADEVPHIIWTYWAQGWATAPALCHTCIESWRKHHPGWEIRTLDRAKLSAYIPAQVLVKIDSLPTHQAKSDYIRSALLKLHGGVWVDATTFCSQPLEQWLPALQGGMFFFSMPIPRLCYHMTKTSSWFIAAPKDSYMAERLYRDVVKYWETHTVAHYYFWLHKLFDGLYDRDVKFQRMWDRIEPINVMHSFNINAATPVHKLNHRRPPPHWPQ